MSSPERNPEKGLFDGKLSKGEKLDWSISESEPMPIVKDHKLFHQKAIEAYRDIKEKANPEGIVLGGAISFVSVFTYPGIEAAMTAGIREAMAITNPDVFKAAMVITLAGANGAGILVEALTLKMKRAAATAWGPMGLVVTNEVVAAAGDYAISNALMITINPISAFALYAGDNPLLFAGAAATSLAHVAWATGWNAAIALGVADKPIAATKRFREKTIEKTKRALRK